jgi:hypothetical protein
MGSKLARKGARVGGRSMLCCLAFLFFSLAFAPVQNWMVYTGRAPQAGILSTNAAHQRPVTPATVERAAEPATNAVCSQETGAPDDCALPGDTGTDIDCQTRKAGNCTDAAKPGEQCSACNSRLEPLPISHSR